MTTNPPTMIFTMGLPAAGKTTWVTENLPNHTIIDPDAVKESHPDYDPKDPNALHAWSQEVVEHQFATALLSQEGEYVVDGTGTNAEKMVRRMEDARAAGFRVDLVYVTVSLKTSLARNASRARVVPEAIVRGKAKDIQTSFSIVAPYADNVRVVKND